MNTTEHTLHIAYKEYASVADLPADDRTLMQAAIDATATAYAPYSHFHVGAAVRLAGGKIVKGSNQENAAYPSGLCAERTALFAAGSQHPQEAVTALAIVARNEQGQLVEAAPCGACRQVLLESQQRAGAAVRVLMYLDGGRIRMVDDAATLLPFSFSM
ncbi:MAG: cytidine deaminase [Bacteroidales bacterium]|nr:cytidine deaminase [Bacteroidales bacterium]